MIELIKMSEKHNTLVIINYTVCVGGKGYKGGGLRRDDWWRQEATEIQLWATLEVI